MCLITDQEEPFIATEDMIVYKEMNINENENKIMIQSIYNHFIWNLNELYKTDIKLSSDFCVFDSYDNQCIIQKYPNFYNHKKSKVKSFGKGFHSALSITRLAKFHNN